MIVKLFLLVCGHAVADFCMQTEWIAKYKNRNNLSPAPKGQKQQSVWGYVLTSHALHHGLMVYLVTKCVWLGILETISHWIIDFGKCENWYGIHIDQGLHLICKLVWLLILVNYVS